MLPAEAEGKSTVARPEGRLASPEEILDTASRSAADLARRMERRLDAHLILGTMIGLAGSALWYVAFSEARMFKEVDLQTLMLEVLPRLPILVIAGFFLRPYRIGVEHLKYFSELQREAERYRGIYSIVAQPNVSQAEQNLVQALLEKNSDLELEKGEATSVLATTKAEENVAVKALSWLGS